MQREKKITEDGSTTLFFEKYNDTYHSIHGAIDEAEIVYINNGFRRANKNFKDRVKILEIGFGTGLNALLTALENYKSETLVEYYTIEAFPLEESEWNQLNFFQLVENREAEKIFQKLHKAQWNEMQEILPNFKLFKIKADFTTWKPSILDVNLIYYDAFGPDKQPEMWQEELLKKVSQIATKNAVFVTYSTKSELRHRLSNLGFEINKLPGPKGKREVLQAIKL
ncbi:MAG: tRNA (5-methylaminomethyl-2-thiouridine)(34)-methyltransferase MnmD [Bacteroidales bacterium]|jgi:tRNA U34 5-methylaminomethyl-2-thiouridine-forming methyltransferase MnmC|nr:tRNA (5-methylaminomethyl-2-thiouridine)(34)-methyltransferase MnmD [Bacteroidales bacterium]